MRLPRLTYANVVSTLALFVAVAGGTAIAVGGGNAASVDGVSAKKISFVKNAEARTGLVQDLLRAGRVEAPGPLL